MLPARQFVSNGTYLNAAPIVRSNAMYRAPYHRLAIIVALVSFFSVIQVSDNRVLATDYYVDNVNGNDLSNGTAPINSGTGSAPFKTIGRALRAVRGGDRVILARNDEPYRECITLEGARCSGTAFKPFEFIGNGATLDGSVSIHDAEWEHVDGNVFRFRPDHPSNQILFLNGRPADRKRSGDLSTLKARQWALRDGYIYFCVEKDRLPALYDLSICGHLTGITLYQVRHIVISELIVQGFRLDGLNAHDLVSQAEIHSSNLRGNGRSGISVGGASRFAIESCLLGNNSVAQLRTEGYCKVESSDVDLVEDKYALRIAREGGKLQHNGEPIAGNIK